MGGPGRRNSSADQARLLRRSNDGVPGSREVSPSPPTPDHDEKDDRKKPSTYFRAPPPPRQGRGTKRPSGPDSGAANGGRGGVSSAGRPCEAGRGTGRTGDAARGDRAVLWRGRPARVATSRGVFSARGGVRHPQSHPTSNRSEQPSAWGRRAFFVADPRATLSLRKPKRPAPLSRPTFQPSADAKRGRPVFWAGRATFPSIIRRRSRRGLPGAWRPPVFQRGGRPSIRARARPRLPPARCLITRDDARG